MSETPVHEARTVDDDPALAARVRTALGDPAAGPLTVLEGGRSGLTYRLDGASASCVVKAVPPGRAPIGRNDVLRQASVLSALAGRGVPVPGVLAREDAEPGWFAMEFAAGEAVEPVLDVGSPVDAGLARARMLAAAGVLGALHAVPLVGLGIGLTAVAAELPDPDDPGAELERWTKMMHAVPAGLRPGAEELLETLGRMVPAAVQPVLLHFDFRLGNLLCVEQSSSALVDWEIWSVGDPRVDLGWFGVFTSADLFPGVGRDVPGLPTEDELFEAYVAARGTDGGAGADQAWFRALGRMKMAAIMGHNLRRHREGRHHDPTQEQLPDSIDAMIAQARELLDGSR